MNSFYLYIQSRSVDKQHAVISVNLENAEYKLHDLGTLNGVSMSIPWNAKEDPIKLEVLESCVLKPQIGINLQDAQGTQTASVCSNNICHLQIAITTPCSPLPPAPAPTSRFCQGAKEVWFIACHLGKLLPVCISPRVF